MARHKLTAEERKKGSFGVGVDPVKAQKKGAIKRAANRAMEKSITNSLMRYMDDGTVIQDYLCDNAVDNKVDKGITLEELLTLKKLKGEDKTTLQLKDEVIEIDFE